MMDCIDRIEALEEEIGRLSAHIFAATHQLLVLIAEFDRLRGWEPSGHASCADWLAAHTGIDHGAAREKVRAARALESLPLTSAAMARGALSFSKVRALTRVAQPDNEATLLELASGATTAQVERLVRGWRHGDRQDEVARERQRFESRTLSIVPDLDGMYVIRGRLAPEVGALLMRAIEAASDALYQDDPTPGADAAARRRADALALIAERALAAGFGADEAPVSGTRAERYQVVLHVEPETLAEAGETGRSELEDGTRVSDATSKRATCDASVVRVEHAADGSVLNVGRRKRTIPPALRRALEVRDRGCRFPRCGRRFTDAHHMQHWADGGETSLANCLLLCGHHHRLVHEGGWRVQWWGSAPVFISPRGHEHFDGSWRPPELPPRPVERLIEQNRRRGVAPDGWTAAARWRRERDIPPDLLARVSELV
jgi:hypothetical protein